MSQPKTFRRSSATSTPVWFIKGSFVLDVLFNTTHANDIDVCWLSSHGQPQGAAVREWLSAKGLDSLAAGKNFQFVRVTDPLACDGGGAPHFNIDCWQLDMDGHIYDINLGDKTKQQIMSAQVPTLSFLPIQPEWEPLTREYAVKARKKMQTYPHLYNSATDAQLSKILRKGCLTRWLLEARRRLRRWMG